MKLSKNVYTKKRAKNYDNSYNKYKYICASVYLNYLLGTN